MVETISSLREQSTLKNNDSVGIFNGLTLMQVAPRYNKDAFVQVHHHVSQFDDNYPRYIECKAFAKYTYDKLYKGESYVAEMRMLEPHDKHSVFVYSVDKAGWINGTLRLCRDSDIGLPMADSVSDVIEQYRKDGLIVAEPGRFATSTTTSHRLVSAAYEIARYAGIDIYMMQCRADHRAFYETNCGAKVLTGYSAPDHCINMIWPIADTPDLFFSRYGNNQNSLRTLMSTLESYDD